MAGSAMAPVALAFAVLEHPARLHDRPRPRAGRAADRRLSCFLLFGGVWSDRLPRHRVMVASNLAQRREPGGRRRPSSSAGHAQLWELAALAAVNGVVVGVLLPGQHRDRPADRGRADAPAGERDAAARAERDEHRRRRARRDRSSRPRAPVGRSRSTPRPTGSRRSRSVRCACRAGCASRAAPCCTSCGTAGSDFWSRPWLWAIVLQFGIVNAVENGAVQIFGPRSRRSTSAARLRGAACSPRPSLGLIAERSPACSAGVPAAPARRDARGVPARAAAARAREAGTARGRDRGGVPRRVLHRDLRRAVGHDDAAGDPAREALARCRRTTRSARSS